MDIEGGMSHRCMFAPLDKNDRKSHSFVHRFEGLNILVGYRTHSGQMNMSGGIYHCRSFHLLSKNDRMCHSLHDLFEGLHKMLDFRN